MNLVLPNVGPVPLETNIEQTAHERSTALPETSTGVVAHVVWHSLVWLVVANCVGILLAAMLLFPRINDAFGEWTYGRWMPVHLNLQLYGWCSLPLVAFLFKVYGADERPAANWSRSVLWLWSGALAAGVFSWLGGHSSGKLFLDWTGYPRVLFPVALFILWILLVYAFVKHRRHASNETIKVTSVKIAGLALLLSIPFLIYFAANPSIYPPINPDTGGPTGASQLESTLVIIAVFLLLPFGLVERPTKWTWQLSTSWFVFAAEALLCLGLGRADVSHHRPVQWISLGSLLLWIPLTPAYYAVFHWHANTNRWRIAFLCWWAVLIPTGWMLFLPGVLDHFKFTDGLVAHSLLAMGGFVSSLLIFVMIELLGDEGWIFNTRWSFILWQTSVIFYVVIMFYAGYREGFNPAFSFIPGTVRNTIYAARLLLGVFMLIASVDWLFWSFSIVRRPASTVYSELR
jgi:cytochrome c oxidase cbb3-type subunit I